MNEFSLIEHFFQSIPSSRQEVKLGIGDDAAIIDVPEGMELLVSSDTLVANTHFLPEWDAFDIAYKAVMVNVSDIAAMGGEPCWISLSLTLPMLESAWLSRFSNGLKTAVQQHHLALIGGDTTQGPLSISITIHGFAPKGTSVRRSGAQPGDNVYISGVLGGAALAVKHLHTESLSFKDKAILMEKLNRPKPRVDLADILRCFASAAIDISDGLSSDLNHICTASGVRAELDLKLIPVHPLVTHYQVNDPIDFALNGGDDYELCFTVPYEKEPFLLEALRKNSIPCYAVGKILPGSGLWAKDKQGKTSPINIAGYQHF